jgi:tetratricopeptide (TPR) repeat protein
MTPDDRKSVEGRADRALRRGELSEAFALFQELERAFPDDLALRAKIANLKESLQPAELFNAKSNFKAEPTVAPSSETEAAERLAATGDSAGAISIYRRLLAERPDNELIRDRLAELFTHARASAPRPPRPEHRREAVLGDLLSRIGARRRT